MPASALNVQFTISDKKDFEGYLKLARQLSKDVLNEELKKEHPGLINDSSDDVIKQIITTQFKTNKESIMKRTAAVKDMWLRIEDRFYKFGSSLFSDINSKRRYIVYPSILSHFIRDLHTGEISFPINKPPNHGVFVITHELLHCFFFEHLATHYPDLGKRGDKNLVWAFSEVLNVFIQEQDEWIALTSITPTYYPQHKELYFLMRPYWLKRKNIDLLIKRFLLNPISEF